MQADRVGAVLRLKTQVVGPDELVPYEELVERKREGRLDGLNPAALEVSGSHSDSNYIG